MTDYIQNCNTNIVKQTTIKKNDAPFLLMTERGRPSVPVLQLAARGCGLLLFHSWPEGGLCRTG